MLHGRIHRSCSYHERVGETVASSTRKTTRRQNRPSPNAIGTVLPCSACVHRTLRERSAQTRRLMSVGPDQPSGERDFGLSLTLIPSSPLLCGRFRQRHSSARGSLEPTTKMSHRLDPILALDAQPIQDRRQVARDRPALAEPELSDRVQSNSCRYLFNSIGKNPRFEARGAISTRAAALISLMRS